MSSESINYIKQIITGLTAGVPGLIVSEAVSKIFEALTTFAMNVFDDITFRNKMKESLELYKRSTTDNFAIASFENDLRTMFSSSEYQELFKKYSYKNGYEYLDVILLGFKSILEKYGIRDNIQDELIETFEIFLINEIKKNNEELYRKINESLVYKDIQQKIKRDYKTISDYDLDLKNNTKLSNGIDFFETDDIRFKEDFKCGLNKESIYISCQNFKECIYIILNLLRAEGLDNKVRIIENADIWNNIISEEIGGIIYIPNFHSDRINAIKNNTCIFIIEDQIVPFITEKPLKLENRLNKSIVNSLIKTKHYDYEQARELVLRHHGMFEPIFHELQNGKDVYIPKWYNALDNQFKCICAMIGQWVNCDGDKNFIEQLYGSGYDTYKKSAYDNMDTSDPLFLEYDEGMIKKYVLASTSTLYDSIKIDYDSELWNKFDQLCHKFIAKYYDNNAISEELFVGVLGFLNYFVNVKNDYKVKCLSKNIIEELLTSVNSKDKWEKISNHLVLLSEICPNTIIKRINDSLDKKDDFIILFKYPKQKFLGISAYINILQMIETLLIQKDYCMDAFKILVKICNISEEIQSNNPKDLIYKILCIAYNYSAINTVSEKDESAKYLLDNCDVGWDILFEQISSNNFNIMINTCKPKYRETEEQSVPNGRDIINLYKIYFNLLVDNVNNNGKCLSKFLESHAITGGENMERIKSLAADILKNSSDDDKLEIEFEIRKYIYDNRFHKTAIWSIEESLINDWENILSSIRYSKEEYRYIYLFALTNMQIIKNPVKFNDENCFKRNSGISNKILAEEFKMFKEQKLCIKTLISKLSQICGKSYNVGNYIGLYYSNGKYDNDILDNLYDVNQKWALDYYSSLTPYNKDITKKIICSNRFNDSFKAGIYKIDFINCDDTPLIKNESNVEVLEEFWNSDLGPRKDMLQWQIEQLIKYESTDSLLECIYIIINNNLIDDHTSFIYFKNIIEMRCPKKVNAHYEIEKIIEHFESVFKNQDDIIYDLARIELKFYPILKHSGLCSLKCILSKNAKMYAELCSCVYKDDSGKKKDISQDEFSLYFEIFLNLKFNIGTKEKDVYSGDLLKKWVSDFKQALDDYNISNLFYRLLGKVIGFNTVINGFKEPLVNLIEENGNDDLIQSIATEHYNSYGVRYIVDGSDWLERKREYTELHDKMNSDGKRWTAKLLKAMADDCDAMYMQEREMLQNNE